MDNLKATGLSSAKDMIRIVLYVSTQATTLNGQFPILYSLPWRQFHRTFKEREKREQRRKGKAAK